jgi:PhoH-like ATPase
MQKSRMGSWCQFKNGVSAVTSGLTYIVEKFKNFSGSATINLDGVVRSRLAEFAEEQL